jgi:hypothetical protein
MYALGFGIFSSSKREKIFLGEEVLTSSSRAGVREAYYCISMMARDDGSVVGLFSLGDGRDR